MPQYDSVFGLRIRELRLERGMQQQQLAEQVKMQVHYLSKIERGSLPPPSEEKIRIMAEILRADVDELLHLAQKVPADVPTTIIESPKVPQFLRTAKGLSDDQWDELIRLAKQLREK